ncbi:TPA: hypothetical protein ACGO1T_001900, partial [Streptococcus suis]
MKKYILLENETTTVNGSTLYRIIAIKDFGGVKIGEKGGWIEKEENLSHEGDCWVDDKAMVYGDAMVYDNAKVFGDTWIYGNAKVYDDADVFGNARIY